MDNLIDQPGDDAFMSEALRFARKAFEKEEVPVGAIVVRNGKIIARAFNQVELLKDATAHAEMLAITQAEAAVGGLGPYERALYVTNGPWRMCGGGLVHDRMLRVVFRRAPPPSGAAGRTPHLLPSPSP